MPGAHRAGVASGAGAQAEVVDFLSSPAAYRRPGRVERVDTHISTVFLAGDRAYKLKRAVRYDYVDFSTVERRRKACEAEVRLNRRTAPSLYLGVVPVIREAGGRLALGGKGTPVDWLVEMVRFDEATLFDRLAARRALDPALMPPLADAIVRLHAAAERRPDHGGSAGMAWVIEGNAAGLAEQGRGFVDAAACRRLTERAKVELDRLSGLLEARREAGAVRWCHGDLHLRNIFLLDGRPTLFDAVEFNAEIACTDVLYDLAFLLMDLWRRDLKPHASLVFNAYMEATGDVEGLAALPLFLSCRAAVRAKTSATAANGQPDEATAARLRGAAREYLRLGGELLEPPRPRLLAIGGLSGTGKTALARRLAPGVGGVPGALVVRSDVIRKQLLGRGPLERLGDESYAPEVSRAVYERLADRAAAALRAGHSAIADAVCAEPARREAIERCAREAGAPFIGLWLEAPEDVLLRRVGARTADASDATEAVVRGQLALDVGAIGWRRFDASPEPESVARAAEAVVM